MITVPGEEVVKEKLPVRRTKAELISTTDTSLRRAYSFESDPKYVDISILFSNLLTYICTILIIYCVMVAFIMWEAFNTTIVLIVCVVLLLLDNSVIFNSALINLT